jgi:predicted methyltransferase
MRTLLAPLCLTLVVASCEKGETTRPPDATPPTAQSSKSVADEPDEEEPAAMGPNYQAYEVSDAAKAVINAEDRAVEDQRSDMRRRPAETLTFMEVQEGWKVADLGAGGGYTTELLVRAVGPRGEVWAQNDTFALENYAKETWPARLRKKVNKKRIARIDADFEDPLPDEAKDLDLVSIIFSYHDVVARGGDVTKMNAAIFEHLKPGGFYVVFDHSARPGSGTQDTEELHRIDEKLVIQQVEAAGFELVESANFLRDPGDTRDWKVWERGYVTDRFALKFQKPTGG